MKHNFTFLVLIFNFSKVVLQKQVEFFGETIENAFAQVHSHTSGIYEGLVANEEVTGRSSVLIDGSNFFDNQLRNIKMGVSSCFDKLLHLKYLYNEDLFQFLTPEQVANWREYIEDMPQVSWHNDITGNIMNLAISSISSEGIFGYITNPDFENDAYRQIKFSELASVDDKITLLKEMEDNVKQHI